MSGGLSLLARLRGAAVIDPEGRPGPEARRWSPGSFARVWLDDPGRVVLYANRQGGFGIRCPVSGDPIVPAFREAVTRWRSSGARELVCPACGAVHPLDDVAAAPPIAFGRFAIVTSDVGEAALTPEALLWAETELGPIRMVERRG